MSNNSLGGIGQRVAGAYPHTLKIWDYVNEHPGATHDELKAKALELDWIDRGYAHRWYAEYLKRPERSEARKPSACLGVAEIAATRSDDAVKAVLTKALALMRRDGTVRQADAGGYHAVRRPKATAQVDARVRPRDEVMAGIALNEARRKLLAYGIDRLKTPAARLPLDIRLALAKWLEAGQLVEHDID